MHLHSFQQTWTKFGLSIPCGCGYEGGFARRLRVSIKHQMQRSPMSTVGQADAEGPRDSHKTRLLTGPELPVCMHVYIGVIFA